MQGWNAAGGTAWAFILLGSVGCSRQPGVLASGPAFTDGQHPPFAEESSKGGISPTAALSPSEIPAGTPITVRVQSVISSARAQPGDSFQAILESPIIVGGVIVVPRGLTVTGKVLAAKGASPSNEFGYVRLALTAISLQGRTVPLQTAGIFVKGLEAKGLELDPRDPNTSGNADGVLRHSATKDVEFPAASRLTFRLSRPLSARY